MRCDFIVFPCVSTLATLLYLITSFDGKKSYKHCIQKCMYVYVYGLCFGWSRRPGPCMFLRVLEGMKHASLCTLVYTVAVEMIFVNNYCPCDRGV